MIDWKTWKPQQRANLLFILRGDEILLIRKKRGFGAGKINGPGGKVDPGETPIESALRETEEELGVRPLDAELRGDLHFQFSDGFSLQCAVFLARKFEGEAHETEEAIPLWAGVTRELNIHPDDGPQWRGLPRISASAERNSDELPQAWTDLGEPFPRWLLEAALEVCQTRGDVGRRSSNDVLVHTDLHYQNILARPGTGQYLAIDPQIQVGDAEYAVAPCLWNRLQDLPAVNAAAGLRRRASKLAQSAVLDEDLCAQWAVLREVDNALSYFAASRPAEAQRSLWVASTMAGKTLPGLPDAHQLHRLS